jgi:hypothetical protein
VGVGRGVDVPSATVAVTEVVASAGGVWTLTGVTTTEVVAVPAGEGEGEAVAWAVAVADWAMPWGEQPANRGASIKSAQIEMREIGPPRRRARSPRCLFIRIIISFFAPI